MTKIIYIAIAVLVVVMMLSNRAASSRGEESNVALLAYVAILGCAIVLVAQNVRAAAGQSTPVAVLSGPITVLSVDQNRVSDIVANFGPAGKTKGWMEIRIGESRAFMRTLAIVTDGGVVTAAGIPGPTSEILAIRDHGTQEISSLPQPTFAFGTFVWQVGFQTLFLVPLLIGIYTLKGTTRGYNWTHTLRRAIDESRQLVVSGGGSSQQAPRLGW